MKTKTRFGVGGLVTMLALGVGVAGAQETSYESQANLLDAVGPTFSTPESRVAARYLANHNRSLANQAQRDEMKKMIDGQNQQVQQPVQQQVQPVIVYQTPSRIPLLDGNKNCFDHIIETRATETVYLDQEGNQYAARHCKQYLLSMQTENPQHYELIKTLIMSSGDEKQKAVLKSVESKAKKERVSKKNK